MITGFGEQYNLNLLKLSVSNYMVGR